MHGMTTKSVTKTQYDRSKSKMWKGSENVKRPKTAIRCINVRNAARKNMSHLPANADYAHHAEQRQQTNGPMKFIINF